MIKNKIPDKLGIKIAIVSLSIFVILYLLWANSFDKIENLLNQISYYQGSIIHVKGNVITSFSLPFTGSLYKLEDNTGSIWVISKVDTIEKNAVIFLSGTIKTSIDLDSALDKQLTQYNLKIGKIGPVLVEEKREDFFSTVKNIFKNYR